MLSYTYKYNKGCEIMNGKKGLAWFLVIISIASISAGVYFSLNGDSFGSTEQEQKAVASQYR